MATAVPPAIDYHLQAARRAVKRKRHLMSIPVAPASTPHTKSSLAISSFFSASRRARPYGGCSSKAWTSSPRLLAPGLFSREVTARLVTSFLPRKVSRRPLKPARNFFARVLLTSGSRPTRLFTLVRMELNSGSGSFAGKVLSRRLPLELCLEPAPSNLTYDRPTILQRRCVSLPPSRRLRFLERPLGKTFKVSRTSQSVRLWPVSQLGLRA